MSERFWRRTLSHLNYGDDGASGPGVTVVRGKNGPVYRLTPGSREAQSANQQLLAELEQQRRARMSK